MKTRIAIVAVIFLIGILFITLAAKSTSLAGTVPQIFLLSDKLIASDQETDSEFGYTLALSGDAQVLVVGAPLKAVGANEHQGKVYIYERDGDNWMETQTLVASDGETGDEFGSSLSIAKGSNYTIIVGAPKDDIGLSTDLGSAYIFTYNGSTWSQQAKLDVNDPDQSFGDGRGSSVAISQNGNTAYVGTPGVESSGNYKGAVYIFERSGDIWNYTDTIGGPITDAAGLGSAMLLTGDDKTLFVKGTYSPGGPLITYYLVRVYQEVSGNWTEVDTLIPSDSQEFDDFGDGMAATEDGSVLLVGAPNNDAGGKVFFFSEAGEDWTEQAAFSSPPDATNVFFGTSIALDDTGTQAVIGAWLNNSGGLYRYERNGNTWVYLQTLKTPDDRQEHLGISAAMSGDASMILGGARAAHPDPDTYDPIGAVYIYTPGFQLFIPIVSK